MTRLAAARRLAGCKSPRAFCVYLRGYSGEFIEDRGPGDLVVKLVRESGCSRFGEVVVHAGSIARRMPIVEGAAGGGTTLVGRRERKDTVELNRRMISLPRKPPPGLAGSTFLSPFPLRVSCGMLGYLSVAKRGK